MQNKKSNFVTVVNLFRDRCQNTPHAPLYSFTATGLEKDATRLSYSELERKILAAAALIQQHTQPGDRVLMIFAPGLDYVITFWACLFSGVLAVPAYPPFDRNTVEKLQAIIENSTPTLILSNKEIITNIKRLGILKNLANNKFLNKLINKFSDKTADLYDWDFDKFRWLDINKTDERFADKYKSISIKPESIAYLQYTSGSTGMPKGVKVSHHNLLSNLELVFDTIGRTENERMVSWLPPYHDMGLIGNLLFPVYTQFPILMMSPITFLRHPHLWLQAISDFNGSISGGPNFAYELCTKKIEHEHIDSNLKLGSWRIAYNGAEHINHKTQDNFHAKFNQYGFHKKSYYPIYGLAESTVFVSGPKTTNDAPTYLCVEKNALNENKVVLCDEQSNNAKILVSCGKPMVELVIASEFHQRCTDGEIGEIWLRGDSVTSGYWQKDNETKETYYGLINNSVDKNYLKTGDLGFILNENLYITGRIKDLIIINGKNHYPHDIELIVDACDARLRLGCTAAFSVTHNDEEKLAIVSELKKSLRSEEYRGVIHKIKTAIHLNYGLETYLIVLIPPKTIPKTTSGKLRRSHTKKLLEYNQLNFLYCWNIDERAHNE